MKMKKLAVLIATLTLASSSVGLVGCTDEADKRVMNLSLNPEVEFVLDENDKVISVNALNEEGNLIVSAEVFTGKTAGEAAELFVEVSRETGFLVTGKVKAGENELKVSFSGDADEVQKLYDGVKEEVEGYLSENNVTATISQAAAITNEKLKALVLECAPYLEEAKIQAMDHAELVSIIEESRKETAKFYSQELKNAYYEAKAFAMEQAELQAIKVQENITGVTEIMFNSAYTVYTTAIETIETTRMTMLVAENSPYQLALKAFRKAKTDYLQYRNYVASLEESALTTQISEQLAEYAVVVDNAETALVQAGVDANAVLDNAKATLKTAYESVVALIGEYANKVSKYATEIATKRSEAQATFFSNFESEYAAAITAAKNDWSAMQTTLKNGE